MIAASVWSLLIPSIEMADKQDILPWIPATVGLLSGNLFLIIIDIINSHLPIESKTYKKSKMKLKKTIMMVFAVTLHNIPEGMAVGVIFAGALAGDAGITMSGAFALALGIAIQNFPEGAIISMPLKAEGMSKVKAFIYGLLSGVVEPIAAGITLILTRQISQILPYLLAFAAGAMINVVVEELIPDSQSGKNKTIGTIGVAIGFSIMMILDVALG